MKPSAAQLRRAWRALMRVLDAIGRTPMEDVADRLERLEREVAARD